jgi:hypothetical protein
MFVVDLPVSPLESAQHFSALNGVRPKKRRRG